MGLKNHGEIPGFAHFFCDKTIPFLGRRGLQSLRQSRHPKALRRGPLRAGRAGRGRRRGRGRRGLERDPRKMEGKIMKNKQKRINNFQ